MINYKEEVIKLLFNIDRIYTVEERWEICKSLLNQLEDYEENCSGKVPAYHNKNHAYKMMIKFIEKYKDECVNNEKIHEFIRMLIAIGFHDYDYSPLLEIQSPEKNIENTIKHFIKFFDYECASHFRYYLNESKLEIINAIRETGIHKPTTRFSEILIELDLDEILNGDLETFMDIEDKISNEFSFVNDELYKTERVKILRKLGVSEDKLTYVKNRKRNIGIYVGSFNPFHTGHLHIVEQASKIFDKVIIVRMKNLDKDVSSYEMPEFLNGKYEVIESDKNIFELMKDMNYPTLIRGMRNSNDFADEFSYQQTIRDVDDKINFCNFICDKEFSNISSSVIRTLNKIGIEKYKV